MNSAIETARRAVEKGRAVDLLEIEMMAERICLDLAHQPRDEARRSAASVEALVAALDELANDIAAAKLGLDRRLEALADNGGEPG
jgi:hypothetical protein